MKIAVQCRFGAGTLLLSALLLLQCVPVFSQWSFRNNFGNAGGGTEQGNAVCMDNAGNVYMTGQFVVSASFGSFTLTGPGANGFVAKFDPAGVCQWAIRFGGTNGTAGMGIATDGASVYVTGKFTGNMTVGASPTVYATSGGTDGVVMKLNASTGVDTWVKTFGGGPTGADFGQSICLDVSGNVYISGVFQAPNAVTFGSFSRTASGGVGWDLFVAKLDAAGTFTWVSTGGASGEDDNSAGSSICYVPGLNEVVVTGSYANTSAIYTTSSPASSVSLSASAASLLNFCLLEVNAADGTFLQGLAGTSSDDEQGLGIAYDALTQNVFFTGSFRSSSLSIGGNTINNTGAEDIFYGRYNPATNAVAWVKAAGSTGFDKGAAICSNSRGEILVTGYFYGVASFSTATTPLTLTNTRTTGNDIFLVKVDATTGNALLVAKGAGDNTSAISNQGFGVAAANTGNIWLSGTMGSNITFSPLSALAPIGSADIVLARYSDPPAALSATTSSASPSCSNGCNGSATVIPTGGIPPYTYSWSPSGGSGPTASNLCAGSYTCTITDAISTSIMKMVVVAFPTTTLPTSAGTFTNATFNVSASNTIIADNSCNLIATLVPNGGIGTQVSGTVNAKMWIESSVPSYGGSPFVARHYEITPATNAANATGRVTLYFTQAEFNAFNAAPGSLLKLPTGSGDGPGKMRLRIGKYSGTSSGTGLPTSYSGAVTVIDPADEDIVFNTGVSPNRWEVSFNVTGFSGFIVQTAIYPLPLTWLNISASLDDQLHAIINWKVEERDVALYTIEKSVDGTHFTAMANIASQGNGTHLYHYREAQPLQGTATYRIRQTDKDGAFTYSKILLLKGDKNGWVTVYPNPVKDQLTLNITDNDLLNTTAFLYDATGKLLQQITIVQSVTNVSMQAYTKGVYLLKLQNGRLLKLVKE